MFYYRFNVAIKQYGIRDYFSDKWQHSLCRPRHSSLAWVGFLDVPSCATKIEKTDSATEKFRNRERAVPRRESVSRPSYASCAALCSNLDATTSLSRESTRGRDTLPPLNTRRTVNVNVITSMYLGLASTRPRVKW